MTFDRAKKDEMLACPRERVANLCTDPDLSPERTWLIGQRYYSGVG